MFKIFLHKNSMKFGNKIFKNFSTFTQNLNRYFVLELDLDLDRIHSQNIEIEKLEPDVKSLNGHLNAKSEILYAGVKKSNEPIFLFKSENQTHPFDFMMSVG